MEGTSLTPQQEKLKALQQLLPEAFAEGKIDWEKLKATLGEDINFNNERYVLNWAGKSDAFKVLQTPTTKTLVPAKEESINFDETENIFIEGENLEVLKVLQKSYFGKVKMIYIDPPYNTGNDSFIYPDKFSETKAEYERRVGDKDEEGYMTKDGMFKKNSKENGQYHSNWLNMMMPRLYLAKNLLRQDGVIFVSIDDNEVHNLRLLMNEIFGEENFVASIIWKKKYSVANDSKYLSTSHDYIIMYSKVKEFFKINLLPRTKEQLNYYKNLDKDIRGVWQSTSLSVSRTTEKDVYPILSPSGKEFYPPKGAAWRFSKDKLKDLIKDNRIWFGDNGENTPRQKRFLSEVQDGITPSTNWDFKDVGHTDEGKKETTLLFEAAIFDYPKPVRLLKSILQISTKPNDLILDFFAGSGTTSHAVMELNKEDGGNRKYICVQLPELCDENSEAYKAGYKTIAEISKERIRRAGKSIVNGQLSIVNEKKVQLDKLLSENKLIKDQEKIELLQTEINNLQLYINHFDSGFKVLKLAESNFKQWQQIEGKDAKALTEQMQIFTDPVAENATIENMLYEFLLKSGKDLNSKIEKQNEYFNINNGELIMLLETATQPIIEKVIAETPSKVIALDKLFKDNDQLKTNTVLQMRDAGIEFKTV